MVYMKKVNKNTKRRFNKRWSVSANAKIPWAGVNAGFRFNTRSVKPSQVKAIAKREVRKLEEPVHKDILTDVYPLQNTIYSLNPLSSILPTVGNVSQDGYRTGDHIFLEAAKISVSINSTSNSPSEFRLMMVKSGDEYSGSTFGSLLGSTDLFRSTDADHITLSLPNTQKITKVFDERIFVPSYGQHNYFKMTKKEFFVPLKHRFCYKSPTSGYGKYNNYYLALMGYQPGATTGSTVLGQVEMAADIIYKNVL